jgi:hypothetical protein
MNDQKSLDPEAERAIAKVRRLMLIASATTFLAIAAVLGVIGYRISHLSGSAVGDNRIVLTVEVNGAIELYSFDLATLRQLGHARLGSKP